MSARKDKQSRWQKKKAKQHSAYHERNAVLALLARLALTLGWKVGVGQHPAEDKDWEADWRTILFFDSPAGQMSWHFHDSEKPLLEGLPAYEGTWDGHTTPEKYLRVAKCAAELDGVRKAHGVGAFVTILAEAQDDVTRAIAGRDAAIHDELAAERRALEMKGRAARVAELAVQEAPSRSERNAQARAIWRAIEAIGDPRAEFCEHGWIVNACLHCPAQSLNQQLAANAATETP